MSRTVNKFIVSGMRTDTLEFGFNEPREALTTQEVPITCMNEEVPDRDVYRYWKTVNGKYVYEYIGTRRRNDNNTITNDARNE